VQTTVSLKRQLLKISTGRTSADRFASRSRSRYGFMYLSPRRSFSTVQVTPRRRMPPAAARRTERTATAARFRHHFERAA